MKIECVFAAVSVSNIERSIDWYSSLLGRPADDRPMDTLVQWRNLEGAGLQLVLDGEKAGQSIITIVTPSMEHARKTLATQGLELEPDIQGDYGIIAQINDPDGNRITLAEPPKGM